MMVLCSVRDRHAHEVIKVEPACLVLNKDPHSKSHYMRRLQPQRLPPRHDIFPPPNYPMVLAVAGAR